VRADKIAPLLTMEQGKPLSEAKGEVLAGADVIDWFAEEARRTYGRVIPARAEGIYQLVVKEPVGPVAAFTPWNFPINQVVRKLSCALAAGCSIIVKAPEETPASPAELIRCFADVGVPDGVINLVYGIPSEISEYLIPHPIIHKMSFTGSTAVGKQLAAIAGAHMKRVTMELGGHAPAIVFNDADVDTASRLLAVAKYRNAGQVCVSPTRLLVQMDVYDQFVDGFVQHAKSVRVGDGLDSKTTMGPMANPRRIAAMEAFMGDAAQRGATVRTGGSRIGNKGNFFEPTVVTDVPLDARTVWSSRRHLAIHVIRRCGARSQPSAVRTCVLRVYKVGQDCERHRCRRRERHDLDQPPRPGIARSAVRWREGFRLWLRRWAGSNRELSEYEVRYPGRLVSQRRRPANMTGAPVVIRAAAVPASPPRTIDISSLPAALVARNDTQSVGDQRVAQKSGNSTPICIAPSSARACPRLSCVSF
jgi:hypothetical protein